MAQARREIVYKPLRSPAVPTSQHPSGNEFRICANGSPQPNISSSRILFSNLFSAILFLAVNPRPHLIEVQPLARQVPEHFVLVLCADRSDFRQKPHDGLFSNASHAHSGATRAAVD